MNLNICTCASNVLLNFRESLALIKSLPMYEEHLFIYYQFDQLLLPHCVLREFFIYSNIITLRSTVECTWIDNANYFQLIPQLLILVLVSSFRWNCSFALCKKQGGKKRKKGKNIQEPGNSSIPVFLEGVRHEIRNYASS